MNGAAPNRVVVWAALFGGPIAYGGIAASGLLPAHAPPAWPVAMAFGIAAFGALLTGRFLWMRLVAAGEDSGRTPGPAPSSGSDPVLTRAILVWALDESIATFGFALAWLGAPTIVWAPFLAVSMAALAMDHPGRLP